MKKFILTLFISVFSISIGFLFTTIKPVEAKGYGYKSSFKSSYKSYRTPSYRNYNSGGQLKYQRGYYKPSSGKYIEGHLKTGPDNYKWNNRKSLYGW